MRRKGNAGEKTVEMRREIFYNQKRNKHRKEQQSKMKVRSKLAPLKASRIFTDREEPRRAFWKKYEAACTESAEERVVRIANTLKKA